MKSFLACFLFFSLFGSPEPVKSVRPLQAWDLLGNKRTFCTTESINEKKGYFLTAAHCTQLVGMFGEPVVGYIDKKEISILKLDANLDVAILLGPKGVPALHFAKHAPRAGDEIYLIGHPIGLEAPQFFYGHLASTKTIHLDGDVGMTFDIEACRGDSGSAVLNRDGEIVSVLQYTVTDYASNCSHWTGGLEYKNLIKFVQGYASDVPKVK